VMLKNEPIGGAKNVVTPKAMWLSESLT